MSDDNVSRFFAVSRWVVVVAAFAGGCVYTPLSPPAPVPGVEKLSAINPRSIELTIHPDQDIDLSGHQFLLFFVPFGSIAVEHPEAWAGQALEQELAIKGYKILPATEPQSRPRVTLQLHSLYASAYDLFLTRRIRSQIHLTATLTSAEGMLLGRVDRRCSDGRFARFGFQPQLREQLSKVVVKCLKDVLLEMGL